MAKKRKLQLYLGVSTIGVIILLILGFIIVFPYTSDIPANPSPDSYPEAVIDQLGSYQKKAKRIPTAQNLGNLGLVYHANALYEEAATCYQLAIRRSSSDWTWNYYLGYLYLEMGQSDRVLEQFIRVIELNPDVHHAYYYAGDASMNIGQAEKAEEYFKQIRDVKKERDTGPSTTRTDHYALGVYASYQLSEIYVNSGRSELAEDRLKEMITHNRNFGPAYRLLGNIYRMRGNSVDADRFMAAANDLMVYTPPVDTLVDALALLSRSESYLLKMIDDATKSIYSQWALKLVENGVSNMPGSKYLYSKAINVSLWLDKEKEAASYAAEHIKFSANDYSELYDIGMLFFDKELYQVSRSYFLKALELKPDDDDLMKKLARSQWHAGEKKEAIDLLNKVISAHPDNLEVLADVADIMIFELGEREKSMQYYNILKTFLPAHPKVLKITGWMEEQNGNLAEAISNYEASLRGAPGDISTIQKLGGLLISQQMWGKAIAHYRTASALNPGHPEIMERLGTLLIVCPDSTLRNIQEGRVYAERAFLHVSAKPLSKITAGRNLTLAYAMLGDYGNALAVINMTIKIAGQVALNRELLADLENIKKELEQTMDVTR